MDRNALIGFALIGLLVVVYTIVNAPSKEEMERKKRVTDSLALVQKNQSRVDSLAKILADSVSETKPVSVDSLSEMAVAIPVAREKYYFVENDLLKLKISSRGGKIVSVELKNYKTFAQQPLLLFDEASAYFGYQFFAGNQSIETDALNFIPADSSFSVTGNDSAIFRMRSHLTSSAYIEQSYQLRGNDFMLDYHCTLHGMDSVLGRNNPFIQLKWSSKLQSTEKDLAMERNSTSLYFRYWNDDVENISERGTGQITASSKVQWVSFKHHFFNSTLIATRPFDSGIFLTEYEADSTSYVKQMQAEIMLPYSGEASVSYPMQWYFGPNSYQDLRRLDLELQKIIPLGVGLFGGISLPINKYFIIPVFNFLNNYSMNYGVIILIMTILLRILLFPLNYRSFVSAAKMRVLKPELDELREKYKADQQRFGQEQLKLFRQAGVNPLGGCLPLLVQLPILAAMYTFFPLSIELRQQGFWWATDLSTYDSVLNLNFAIPFYGNHVSLWTLIMTITSIAFAVYNNQLSGITGQMKWMTYIFPVMLLGIFNSLPSALTYYYTLTNVFSFLQQWIIKKFILNEDAIHRQIQENKKKPMKKSGWQERLEKLARQQQQQRKMKK